MYLSLIFFAITVSTTLASNFMPLPNGMTMYTYSNDSEQNFEVEWFVPQDPLKLDSQTLFLYPSIKNSWSFWVPPGGMKSIHAVLEWNHKGGWYYYGMYIDVMKSLKSETKQIKQNEKLKAKFILKDNWQLIFNDIVFNVNQNFEPKFKFLVVEAFDMVNCFNFPKNNLTFHSNLFLKDWTIENQKACDEKVYLGKHHATFNFGW